MAFLLTLIAVVGDLDFSEDRTDCLAAHRFESVASPEKSRERLWQSYLTRALASIAVTPS